MTSNLKRICTLAAIAALAGACGGQAAHNEPGAAHTDPANAPLAAAAPVDTVIVYKTPACGCCSNWVDHIRQNGFAVVTHDLNDLSTIKRELGVPAGRFSCHTATVRGYTIEGHVPADLIHRLIAANPRGVKGLTVPGMPMGSPGMEGFIKQKYDVLSFDERGNVAVYATR